VQPSVSVAAVVKVAYWFARQAMSAQATIPSALNLPTGHSHLVTAPPAEVASPVHAVQPSVSVVAVAKVAYWFAGQAMTAQVLTVSEYWPTGHVQVVTAPPAEVAGAVHASQPSVSVVAVAKVAYWSAGQAMSAQVPAGSVYMPIPHSYMHAVAAPPAVP